jgi:two-component system, NtrC family, sensor kinase
MRSLRLEIRIIALALLAAAVVSVGAVNLREQHRYQLPDDGVFWVETASGIQARDVEPESAAGRAELKPGDVLISINGRPVTSSLDAGRQVFRLGIGARARYQLLREGSPLDLDLVLQAQARPQAVHSTLQVVGLLYLVIGLFVLLRRFTARRATHFFLFCLASFVLFVFSFTGKLNNFDWVVYWTSAAALLLQPALFAHFCLSYPRGQSGDPAAGGFPRRKLLLAVIYGSAASIGALHVAVALGVLRFDVPLVELRWLLDRLEIGYLVGMFLLGIALVAIALRHTQSFFLRKQMLWVMAGSMVAVFPFAAFYGLPYLAGVTPGPWMNLSALSLVVLPLTFCYVIVRYRLLDIEIVLERGAAYTLATAVLVGAYFGVAALAGDLFRTNFPAGGTLGVVLAVIATGVLFQPLERWIQTRLERRLLPRRYDYRDALVAFGRELGSQTDLDRMIRSLFDQLARTLKIKQAAVFLCSGTDGSSFTLRGSVGIAEPASTGSPSGPERDYGFLSRLRIAGEAVSGEKDYLFFGAAGETAEGKRDPAGIENPSFSPSWRSTIARLGLHYYFPCRSRNRVVAVLGVGTTTDGEYLWDEDAALIETLAGYLAIAVENAGLLESLVSKATQFERLQEFSQNILESINVGLLAVDLEDRIEAVNTPLRQMSVIRSQAPIEELRGRTLSQVLPADLALELDRLRDDGGIHNIYRYRAGQGGEERMLNIAVAPLLSRDCDLIGRLVVFDDITDRVGLESQLAQAEKLSSIGLLAAGVAHEVNTPLAVISTQAQMLSKTLSKTLPPGDQNLKAMEKIIGQTFRASEIVNSLLNFSRTKGSEFAPLDLNKIISETLLLLDHQLKSARIQLEPDLDGALPAVSGNSDKLQQVFLNLFLNAKDAMPQGGRLRVSTRAQNSHIEIEIGDTGVGIAPEHLNRIYDPFFTTKGSGRGTGLGLAVSYGIIREHSGTITVESAPGHGARFRLEFPAMRKEVHA